MKAALNDVSPNVQQQLCIHHISSNVLLKSKQQRVNPHGGGTASETSKDNTSTNEELDGLSAEDRQFVQNFINEKIPHSYRGVLMM